MNATHVPQVLIIMLKRFHHDSHGSGKVSTPVSFPLDGLDMHPFLVESMFSACSG